MKRILILFIAILSGSYFFSAFAQPAPGKTYLEKLDQKYSSGLFKNDNATIIAVEDDPSASSAFSIFQYLQGRVAGLQIYGSGTLNPLVLLRNGRPALFLDEMRVDADLLASININDIAMVKIFRQPFIAAYGGGNGAIAVYTKKGDEEEEEF